MNRIRTHFGKMPSRLSGIRSTVMEHLRNLGMKKLKDHKRIPIHFVFDVKYDLRRKARLVAGGHLTKLTFNDAPYTGIASIKSIRICLFIAKLNGLKICAADVGNAYLMAMTGEKLCIIAGPEFGELEG